MIWYINVRSKADEMACLF